jgi:hypothetical protein
MGQRPHFKVQIILAAFSNAFSTALSLRSGMA